MEAGRAATAEAASGKKYMSRAVVIPARRHSATASAVPAATDCSDRTAPSAGISRPRKPSRSRSSASPRNIVIARWVWALTRPGRASPPAASITMLAAGGSVSVGPTDTMVSPLIRHVARGCTVRAASIVTTVALVTTRSARVTSRQSQALQDRPRSGPMRSAAASPAAVTSSPSSGTELRPAARLVASDRPRISRPTWRAAMASVTVDMPTRSPPSVPAIRTSAGVSNCGPWKPTYTPSGRLGSTSRASAHNRAE